MNVALLENLCEERGEKISNVIKNLNLAKGSISNWRSGSMPNSDAVVKLAGYFGVSTDYLLGLSEQKNILIRNEEDLKMSDFKKPCAEKSMLERSMTEIPRMVKGFIDYQERMEKIFKTPNYVKELLDVKESILLGQKSLKDWDESLKAAKSLFETSLDTHDQYSAIELTQRRHEAFIDATCDYIHTSDIDDENREKL
jgi:transcriptional regulator with XRE-family HTH domain